jgi:kynurenine formamidase
MGETVKRGGRAYTLYDLSDCLSNDTSPFEFNKHRIEYLTPEQTAAESEAVFGIGPEFWPGGKAAAVETVTLSTHSGTHVDAPAHYGPAVTGTARTIDEVPLSWCFGNGVRLDMTHKDRVEGIARADVEQELERIGHALEPYDIVLVMTGASRRFREPGYDKVHAGLRRDATEFLVDAGVRLIGIDAWGIDRAFDVMIEEAKAGKVQFWESHLLGREKEYCQIERLANLDQLPRPTGFTVCAFPFKLERASASWARVVAIFEDAEPAA